MAREKRVELSDGSFVTVGIMPAKMWVRVRSTLIEATKNWAESVGKRAVESSDSAEMTATAKQDGLEILGIQDRFVDSLRNAIEGFLMELIHSCVRNADERKKINEDMPYLDVYALRDAVWAVNEIENQVVSDRDFFGGMVMRAMFGPRAVGLNGQPAESPSESGGAESTPT